VGEQNRVDERAEQIEKELLGSINNLGIGPGGLGGRVTALAVHIEMMPSHIASLPVAVNIQCHVARHKETTLVKAHLLCCASALRRCGVHKSTPHFQGLARLASGAFY